MRIKSKTTTVEEMDQKTGEASFTKTTTVTQEVDPVDELKDLLTWHPWNFDDETKRKAIDFLEGLRSD